MTEHIQLLIDSHHGQYIPKLFADHCAHEWQGIDATDLDAIRDPECDWYWEAWINILNHATSGDFTLHQDGDLWAIQYDKMTDEERRNFGLFD